MKMDKETEEFIIAVIVSLIFTSAIIYVTTLPKYNEPNLTEDLQLYISFDELPDKCFKTDNETYYLVKNYTEENDSYYADIETLIKLKNIHGNIMVIDNN